MPKKDEILNEEDVREVRAQDYLVTFSTPAGKRVLEDMRKSYGDRTSHVPGDPYETSFREGKRYVYLSILYILEQTKTTKKEKKQTEAENGR